MANEYETLGAKFKEMCGELRGILGLKMASGELKGDYEALMIMMKLLDLTEDCADQFHKIDDMIKLEKDTNAKLTMLSDKMDILIKQK